jgi:hypothetical protein
LGHNDNGGSDLADEVLGFLDMGVVSMLASAEELELVDSGDGRLGDIMFIDLNIDTDTDDSNLADHIQCRV